jgi:hypothetical protein
MTRTSSVSFANPSSLSEVEQDQEVVAKSFIMLKRDVSPWSGLHSLATESSYSNSVYLENRSSVRTNLLTKFDANKNPTTTTIINTTKLMKQSGNKNWELGNSVYKNFNFKEGNVQNFWILKRDLGLTKLEFPNTHCSL